nr:reverse transcriptase domain-containing protein [Tanacetum cinerariifolium]
MEDDLSQPWVCEETDPFTPWICYFNFPKTQMPGHIKTYDRSEDPEDHRKIFKAAAKTERWAMPMWCHMLYSTLTGNEREAGQKQNFKKGSFQNQQRSEQKQDKFTLLTKTPKEIFALDKVKFKPPPPMITPVEKRNASKFCEFHGEVGHTTNECMHLKKQIEEMLKARKLSHLIKELKQSNGKDQAKVAKNKEALGKDKPLAILMVLLGVQKPNGPCNHTIGRVQWRNNMAAMANIVTGVRRIRAVLSTPHGMLKFLVIGETVTLRSNMIIPLECTMVSGLGVSQPVINQVTEEKIQIAIHPEYPKQTIAIADMTGVLRHIAKHRLNIYEGCLPIRKEKRGFDATHNEAEYEALIASLWIAEQMGVKNVQANVDSRLVANQVNGTYVEKEPGMIKYLEKVKNLTRTFKEFFIKQMPRGEKKSRHAKHQEFDKEGIDIGGPFSKCPGKVKFVIVAIDYFTKCIEAKLMATITGAHIKKVVWDKIVYRFGLPGEIISDNGKQFRDNPFKDLCENLCIRQCFDSVKHPQASGLAHRTMIKSSNGEMPLWLTYGTKAMIQVEIGMPTLRTAEVDMIKNDKALEINLDLLEKKREHAAILEAKSKAMMEKYYNASVLDLVSLLTKEHVINTLGYESLISAA